MIDSKTLHTALTKAGYEPVAHNRNGDKVTAVIASDSPFHVGAAVAATMLEARQRVSYRPLNSDLEDLLGDLSELVVATERDLVYFPEMPAFPTDEDAS